MRSYTIGLAGLVLAAATTWWLVAVGGACLVAAWYYTGGRSPYGYRGLGEVSVFVFFGLVATTGTTYVQAGEVTVTSVLAGIGCGALASAILVANNLRDRATDEVTILSRAAQGTTSNGSSVEPAISLSTTSSPSSPPIT